MKKATIDWGSMCIDLYPMDDDFAYSVELNTCDTSFGILDWVLHLMEKSWGTPERISNFIDTLNEAAGYKLHDWLKDPNSHITWRRP